ncbi:MAG: VWA domain-containing protein [Spirochaetes bacterium]|nr:VWA domain-containing protein [Spirochaetota bacterium]
MKKTFLLIFFCSSLLLISCKSAIKSDKYYGIETNGKNIVFLLDISGSMEGKNEGNITDKLRAQAISKAADKSRNILGNNIAGNLVASSIEKQATKLGSAKRELKPAITGLSENTKFTVITFSDKAEFWNKDLQPAEKGKKALAYTFVDRLSSQGGTAALKGLTAAFSVSGVDTIFFLSDGYPSDGNKDSILKEVEKLNKNKKIRIHSIGLGDDKDEDFMKALAADNNGLYKEG